MTQLSHDLALDIRDAAKTYRGRVQALRGITMQVRRGAVFGLLGPNGAGKSTLVKILMTVIRPTRCQGQMLGAPIGDKGTLAKVGYLPEHHKFPDYLDGAQVLDYYGALAGVPRRDRKRRSGELLALVGLTEWRTKKVRGYSKGMRQRLGIANSLMNDPDLVVLDEPTDGVDPVGRRDIRNVLLQLKDQNKTVFLNSHLLSELEMVCDEVAILVQGAVSAQGTIDDLTRDSRRYEIDIAPPESLGAREEPGLFLPRALSGLALLEAAPASAGLNHAPGDSPGSPGTALIKGTLSPSTPGEAPITITMGRSNMTVGTDDAAKIQPLIDALRAKGCVIRAVKPVRASLEDLFMQAVTDPVTGHVLAPGAAPNTKARRGLFGRKGGRA